MTTGITSLTTAGFTTGNDDTVNKNGITYHYVALAGNDIAIGKYCGTGTDDRNISVPGVNIGFLIIQRTYDVSLCARNSVLEGDTTFVIFNTTVTNKIQSVGNETFQIGTDPHVNSDKKYYHYVAIPIVDGIVATNRYIGNGIDGRLIGDVGFKPDVIFLFRPVASWGWPIWKDKYTADDVSFGWVSALHLGEIKTLELTGFKVGAERSSNYSNIKYIYLTLKENVESTVSTQKQRIDKGILYRILTDGYK
jgi:hypothetical protein